jgi:hypothetical protein
MTLITLMMSAILLVVIRHTMLQVGNLEQRSSGFFCLTFVEEDANANIADCMAKIEKLSEENKELTKEIVAEQRARNSNMDIIAALNAQLARNDAQIQRLDAQIMRLNAQREGLRPNFLFSMLLLPPLASSFCALLGFHVVLLVLTLWRQSCRTFLNKCLMHGVRILMRSQRLMT